MRPTYPTPKCHCWNVARDGHATDCVETPHPVVDFVRQAVASEPSLSWPGEIDTIIEDAEAFERSLAAS